MNSSVQFIIVCACLLQVVFAQDTTTLQRPKRPISVQQFRPRASDFYTNLDSIPTVSTSLRQVEPSICSRARQYIDQQLKTFHDIVLRDIKKIVATLATSKSDKVAEATNDLKTANQKVLADFATLGDKFLTDVNTKCAKLSSVATINTVNQKNGEQRAAMMDSAHKLSMMPPKFDAEMQSNYVAAENIIGRS